MIAEFVAGLSISINMHKSVNNPEATLYSVLSVIIRDIAVIYRIAEVYNVKK